MFKDKIFNIVFVFSFGWHVFWISAIDVIVAPSPDLRSGFQEVDFLGPILEKTAFEIMAEEVKVQAETLYSSSACFFLDRVYLKAQGPKRKILKEFIPDGVFNRFGFSAQDHIGDAKETPMYFAEDRRMVVPPAGSTGRGEMATPTLIEGPARRREIIFKPRVPVVPRGRYGNAEGYSVKLKFCLLPNGVVRYAEPVTSSGYPRIDLEAVKFLKGWRFSPSSLVEREKSSIGTVNVKIMAR